VHSAASLATSDVSGELRRANVEGPRRILEAWPGVPFVFVSSASVYPPSRVAAGGRPLAEGDSTGEGLHDDYSRSKLEAEEMLVEESERTGRPVTILRASIIYGPGDRTILPRIRRLRLGGWALVPGGKRRRKWSMTPIDLLNEAARVSVERPPEGVRVLNVAEEPPERMQHLFRRLLEEDAGRRVRVITLPMWLMWVAGAVVEGWCRLFRVSKSPMVTRSAVAYVSEERILDLKALKGFLREGAVGPTGESQDARS
jgi:nucleoside-diphosphate-sugar epimerase